MSRNLGEFLDQAVCSKGNLSLVLPRDGMSEQVAEATRRMVEAVRGYAHIHSTADAVLAARRRRTFWPSCARWALPAKQTGRNSSHG
jgi:hypothetical protein